MWVNNDCPCTKDCPDRWVAVDGSTPHTCRGICKRYEKWVKKREADKKAHAIRMEGVAMTHAQKKAHWASKRRNPYKNCIKRFSE
jgi:hypothetical protein